MLIIPPLAMLSEPAPVRKSYSSSVPANEKFAASICSALLPNAPTWKCPFIAPLLMIIVLPPAVGIRIRVLGCVALNVPVLVPPVNCTKPVWQVTVPSFCKLIFIAVVWFAPLSVVSVAPAWISSVPGPDALLIVFTFIAAVTVSVPPPEITRPEPLLMFTVAQVMCVLTVGPTLVCAIVAVSPGPGTPPLHFDPSVQSPVTPGSQLLDAARAGNAANARSAKPAKLNKKTRQADVRMTKLLNEIDCL